jgi:hypothetical protein
LGDSIADAITHCCIFILLFLLVQVQVQVQSKTSLRDASLLVSKDCYRHESVPEKCTRASVQMRNLGS